MVIAALFSKFRGASGSFAARIEIASDRIPTPTEFLAATLNWYVAPGVRDTYVV